MADSDRFVEFDEGSRVQILDERLKGQRSALTQIGAYLVSQAQSSFRSQGRSSAWPPRMTPNMPGVVRDLNAGQNPKSRRFEPGAALTDTGRLRQSITFQVDKNSVTVGTNLPYAAVHQSGGTSTVTMTQLGRDTLTAFLRENRDEKFSQLGWLFSVPTFEVEVRQRKFIEITAQDREVINEIIVDEITGA